MADQSRIPFPIPAGQRQKLKATGMGPVPTGFGQSNANNKRLDAVTLEDSSFAETLCSADRF